MVPKLVGIVEYCRRAVVNEVPRADDTRSWNGAIEVKKASKLVLIVAICAVDKPSAGYVSYGRSGRAVSEISEKVGIAVKEVVEAVSGDPLLVVAVRLSIR